MAHAGGGGEAVGVLGKGGVRVRQHQVTQRGQLRWREAGWPSGAWPVRQRLAGPLPGQPALNRAGTDAKVLGGFTTRQAGVDGGHEAFTQVRRRAGAHPAIFADRRNFRTPL